jgi:hypothetical protein
MAHKHFHLYKRSTTKNNRYIYYVQFYDESGNRMAARSTGKTSKAAAESWSVSKYKNKMCIGLYKLFLHN